MSPILSSFAQLLLSLVMNKQLFKYIINSLSIIHSTGISTGIVDNCYQVHSLHTCLLVLYQQPRVRLSLVLHTKKDNVHHYHQYLQEVRMVQGVRALLWRQEVQWDQADQWDREDQDWAMVVHSVRVVP